MDGVFRKIKIRLSGGVNVLNKNYQISKIIVSICLALLLCQNANSKQETMTFPERVKRIESDVIDLTSYMGETWEI